MKSIYAKPSDIYSTDTVLVPIETLYFQDTLVSPQLKHETTNVAGTFPAPPNEDESTSLFWLLFIVLPLLVVIVLEMMDS